MWMDEAVAHLLVQCWLLPRGIDENYKEPVGLFDVLTQILTGTSKIQDRSVIE
jgi:hypothetical protein